MKETESTYYESLYWMTHILNSRLNPRAMLRAIVGGTARTVGAKACSLMLLTPDRDVLLHTVAFGLSDWYLRKGPVRASKVISDALQGKSTSVLDATQDERVLYREQAKIEGIASILTVPMKLRGAVIGVLRVYTAEPHRFTKDDIRLVQTIADLSAVALEHLRAYDIIGKDYETFRRDMLQWRADMGYEWMIGETGSPTTEQGTKILITQE